jgi:hypothetical protein
MQYDEGLLLRVGELPFLWSGGERRGVFSHEGVMVFGDIHYKETF